MTTPAHKPAGVWLWGVWLWGGAEGGKGSKHWRRVTQERANCGTMPPTVHRAHGPAA